MKTLKYFLSLGMVGCLAVGTTFAQAQQNTNVPERTRTHFQSTYPQASDAQWNSVDGNYSASFRQDNRNTIADYTSEGEWIGSSSTIESRDMPETTNTYISENYEGYNTSETRYRETPQGNYYEVDIDSDSDTRTINFDEDGNFIDTPPRGNGTNRER